MAFKKTNAKATERKNAEYIDLKQFTVTNVRVVGDNLITFTLKGHGFSLYSVRLVEMKDGTRFIAPAQTKGKDGNYYAVYGLYISPKDTEGLINQVLGLAGVTADEFVDAEGSELPFN